MWQPPKWLGKAPEPWGNNRSPRNHPGPKRGSVLPPMWLIYATDVVRIHATDVATTKVVNQGNGTLMQQPAPPKTPTGVNVCHQA